MNAVNKEALQKYIALEMQEVNSFVEGIDLESVESAKQLILRHRQTKTDFMSQG